MATEQQTRREEDDLVAIVASLVLLNQGSDRTFRFFVGNQMIAKFVDSYISTAVKTGASTSDVQTLARAWVQQHLAEVLPGIQKTISTMAESNLRSHAALIVGTEATAASAAGVIAAANGRSLVWIAVRDSKTDAICMSLDGTTDWAKKYPAGPPIHPNCRCELAVAQ